MKRGAALTRTGSAQSEGSMTPRANISALCHEFTNALTEVLAENAVGLARRGRIARTHAAVKRHPEYNEHALCVAVENRVYAVGSFTKQCSIKYCWRVDDKP